MLNKDRGPGFFVQDQRGEQGFALLTAILEKERLGDGVVINIFKQTAVGLVLIGVTFVFGNTFHRTGKSLQGLLKRDLIGREIAGGEIKILDDLLHTL